MFSMMGWGWVLNTIFWILIVGLVIYGVLTVIMKPFEKNKDAATEDSALQILRERFARGEISEEELERKSELLRKKT